MKRIRYLAVIAVLLLLAPVVAWSMDFGLVVDQQIGYSGILNNNGHGDYALLAIPRFSTLVGDTGEFYISAGLDVKYEFDAKTDRNEWVLVPELSRTEFSWNLSWGSFRLGRMYYSDPLGIIATGLFDGARIVYDTGFGSFGAGAWYTGFLYKKRAEITMNAKEMANLKTKVKYDDFYNTYFAPRRVLAAFDWEHPSLVSGYLRANVSLMGQFDLTGEDPKIHSQYLTAKATVPYDAFQFHLGGSLELIQKSGDNGVAYLGEAGAAWTLPTPFASRLSLLGRYASGSSGSNIDPFMPLTSLAQSAILQPNLPGTSMIKLEYNARIIRPVAVSVSSSYFIRNDMNTYKAYPVSARDNGGKLLGNEFFARVFWIPVSDVTLNVGGGAFLPAMGNVKPSVDGAWRIEMGLVISLF